MIPEVALFVFAFTTVATEVDAVCTSDSVASEPVERAAAVRVRVPYVHMSAAVIPAPPETADTAMSRFVTRCFPTEPGVVKVDVATFHTAAGSPPTDDASDEIDAPREVEAVRTAEFVFAFTKEPSDEDAASTVVFVFAFTTAATDDDADWTSERVARLPEASPAPVSVLVPLVQTSAASVPKAVSVLVPAAQTFVGIDAIDEMMDAIEVPRDERDEPSDVEAVRTVAFVFAFTTAASEVDADAIVASAEEVATTKVRSCFTRSPVSAEPQAICAGNVPWVVVE